MKNLLKYYFQKRWMIVIILSIIVLLINVISYSGMDYIVRRYDYETRQYYLAAANAPISASAILSCLLATFVPIFEFSFKMKKIGIDQYYSLPIKREKLYLGVFIVGLIEIIIPITVGYCYVIIDVLSKEHMYNLTQFIPYYFALIGLTAILYATISFIYCRNNTIFDGVICIIAYIFIGSTLFTAIAEITKMFINDNSNIFAINILKSSLYMLYSPISILTTYSRVLIANEQIPQDMKAEVLSISIFAVFGIISMILFLLLSKKDKAEDSTQISNSYFSYRVIIPIFIISLLITFHVSIITTFVFILICGYFGYCIYQRSFKLKLKNIIVLVSSLAIGLTIGSIVQSITGI